MDSQLTHNSMKKKHIVLTLVEQKGDIPRCHRGHKIGDRFDYDTDRGKLCPMALHTGFPFIDILRYGGTIPPNEDGTIKFCCPDSDTINVFRIDVEEK